MAEMDRRTKEMKRRLTTDIANPTSNAIYARIGFRAEGDDWHFDFIPPQS